MQFVSVPHGKLVRTVVSRCICEVISIHSAGATNATSISPPLRQLSDGDGGAPVTNHSDRPSERVLAKASVGRNVGRGKGFRASMASSSSGRGDSTDNKVGMVMAEVIGRQKWLVPQCKTVKAAGGAYN